MKTYSIKTTAGDDYPMEWIQDGESPQDAVALALGMEVDYLPEPDEEGLMWVAGGDYIVKEIKIANFKDEIYDLFDSGNIKGYEKLCENLNESIANLEKKNYEQLLELEKLSTTNDNQTLEIHKLKEHIEEIEFKPKNKWSDKTMTMTQFPLAKEETEKLIVRKIKEIEEYKNLCKNSEEEIAGLKEHIEYLLELSQVEFKPKNKG